MTNCSTVVMRELATAGNFCCNRDRAAIGIVAI